MANYVIARRVVFDKCTIPWKELKRIFFFKIINVFILIKSCLIKKILVRLFCPNIFSIVCLSISDHGRTKLILSIVLPMGIIIIILLVAVIYLLRKLR